MTVDTDLSANETKTTCPYCGVGCGVIASKDETGTWQTVGDPDHPANFGRLCSKGSALSETLGLEDRLLYPEVNGERVSWDSATETIAKKFKEIAQEHGPEAIAIYLSGQLLTEDYYVANKLGKGFIGTPHVDTNSRLCMASSVAGHKRSFGTDTVPNCYDDLEQANVVVLVGSNTAWCHPVLFQRILKNKRERGAKVVCVDVRGTDTSADSDLTLIVKPGSDAYLFNGLLTYLADSHKIDYDFVTKHCEGFEEAVATARETAPDAKTVARKCGLKEADVIAFWELFTQNEKSVTCYSQGINQSTTGTDKVGAILNCHLATGRIGKPGSGPLSLTGQPNAMGGREVGGLANQLAAHMDFDDVSLDRVRRFWNAPRLVSGPGLKAVDMFDALYDGTIKAIWIMCTNPAVSIPRGGKVREAMAKAELVIVSDCIDRTDTVDFAHIKLPASTWGEKSGTVTNSERRISRQRIFLDSPAEAKPDWWAVCEVAKAMGFGKDFDYAGAAEIFEEHAALSAFENDGSRDFDLSGLVGIGPEAYDELAPVQWPVFKEGGTERLFSDGAFFRPNHKAAMLSITPEKPMEKASAEFPLILNTGRVRDHWHTMARTGKSPRLSTHRTEPFVEISPVDAQKLDLNDGDIARASSCHGEVLLRVRIDDKQTPGLVFSPIHWSGKNTACGRVSDLIASHCDPISGQPESKHTPIKLAPLSLAASALILSREHLDLSAMTYWSRWTTGQCHAYLTGSSTVPEEGWMHWFTQKHGAGDGEIIEYSDPLRGDYRAAIFADGKLAAMMAVREGADLASANTLDALFAKDEFAKAERRAVLSLKPLDGVSDKGPTVCACFSVGLNEIVGVIAEGKATTPEDIGKLLKAGTNCGSCLPEIRGLFSKMPVCEAAE